MMLRYLQTLLVLATIFSHGFALTCFQRSTLTYDANGTDTNCTGGVTTCYSSTNRNSNRNIGSCGSCPGTFADCFECTTDHCNSMTPTAISCLFRATTNHSVNGTSTICHTGVTSCQSYFYADSSTYYGGCGTCAAGLSASCVACSTNNCNTIPPSTISCYNREGTNANSTNNGPSVSCAPGISYCHSYTNGSSLYANCGNCTSNQTSSYGCTSCSTTNCNALPMSTISCFNRTGSVSSSNGTITACAPGITSCYSYEDGSSSYAACGNCTTMQVSNFGCTSCNTTSCNSKKMQQQSGSTPVAGTSANTVVIGVLLLAMMKFF